MWAAILAIIQKILGLFQSKADRKIKESDLKNQKEFKEAKIKVEQAKRTDENERILQNVDGSGSEQDKAAIEEIRRKLGK